MTDVIHVMSEENKKTNQDLKTEFKNDIDNGLRKINKAIPSKYFYDPYGSELFNQITRHPDYYLTRYETHILQTNKKRIAELMGDVPFNLIELGPGEGIKTIILFEEFISEKLNFNYIPIDISTQYLLTIEKKLVKQMPNLRVIPIHSDYFHGLKWLNVNSDRKNFVLFLGSSIGNFNWEMTNSFLRHLWQVLRDGDFVLLGFDLRKDTETLMRAYNDTDGITKEFNLNLLMRINRELGGKFDLNQFQHFPTYNVYTGAMESYLISLQKQTVYVEALDASITFEKIEPIHVEYSYKYLLSQIEDFALQNGFVPIQNFIDSDGFFVDALWQVKKSV